MNIIFIVIICPRLPRLVLTKAPLDLDVLVLRFGGRVDEGTKTFTEAGYARGGLGNLRVTARERIPPQAVGSAPIVRIFKLSQACTCFYLAGAAAELHGVPAAAPAWHQDKLF